MTSKPSEVPAGPSAIATEPQSSGSNPLPTPPTAPVSPPAVPVTPPVREPGSASTHGLVNEVRALASLVQTSLEHMRELETRRISDLDSVKDDYRAALDLLEEKVADLQALHERAEEALVAHIRLIESQARQSQQ